MKRFIFSVSLAVGLCQSAFANPPWSNDGYINPTGPMIDAPSFSNTGTIEIYTWDSVISAAPYRTWNTKFYSNSGMMICSDGFQFDNFNGLKSVPSQVFYNNGLISALDGPSLLAFSRGDVANVSHPVTGAATATPSYLLVSANEITNNGTLSVGGDGKLQLTGKDIDLSHGTQIAGDPAVMDSFANYGYGSIGDSSRGFYYTNIYVNPLGVRDLFWGTGVKNFDLSTLVFERFAGGYGVTTPAVDTQVRQMRGTAQYALPMSGNYSVYSNLLGSSYFGSPAIFAAYVYSNRDYTAGGSNILMNVVLVNTNFVDPSIKADVRFSSLFRYTAGWSQDAQEAIVQFSTPTFDVVTGNYITNAFYLLDEGAAIPNLVNNINYEGPNGYSRPNAYEITTGTPYEWLDGFEPNQFFSPELIWPNDKYSAQKVDARYAIYGAQVGRNPMIVDGLTSSTNSLSSGNYYYGSPMYKDPTNEPCRIELSSTTLDLTGAMLRSEGMVNLSSKNVKGLNSVAIDSGIVSCDLTVPNGSLVLSNVIPSHFRRCRGNVFAWGANWTSVETNAVRTNTYFFHVLVVDSVLRSDYTPSTPSVALTAPRIVIQDPLTMFNKCLFQTKDLTINSAVTLSGYLTTLSGPNLPTLKTFLNDTNGQITALSRVNIGADTGGLVAFTNRGIISSIVPAVKSVYLENNGAIVSQTGGSLSLQANTLVMRTNRFQVESNSLFANANYLAAVGPMMLTAGTLKANNSYLYSGTLGHGPLSVTVTNLLTDSVSGVPGTNAVLNNRWEVDNGLNFTMKPAYGDLFGTVLYAVATNNFYNIHVWPGIDRGATVEGFTNNIVIGHLVVDLQQLAGTTLYFKGLPNCKNAMYVDFLELTNYAASDLRDTTHFKIDPNFKIYFADCNIDQSKVVEGRPGLIWVPQFAGPNSSTNVTVTVGGALGFTTNVFVNRRLALSDLDSNGNKNPNNTDLDAFSGTLIRLNVNGKGSISPNWNLKSLSVTSNYTFTATPVAGYHFVGWSGGSTSKSAKITVAMTRDMQLWANFLPDLSNFQGTYNGLFMPADNIAIDNSGSFTLTMNSTGAFSGKLVAFGITNSITSVFGPTGLATTTLKRSPTETLYVTLQLDMTNGTDRITGAIANKVGSVNKWVANLNGDRVIFSATRKPPVSGLFTMAIKGDASATNMPTGDGYATLSVTNTGVATISGRLADYLPLSTTATVTKDGRLPFFYNSTTDEMVIGWLTFNTKDVCLENTNLFPISGSLNWVKRAKFGTYYTNAISTNVNVVGSTYIAPAANKSVLILTAPLFQATGGALPVPISFSPTNKLAAWTYATNNMSLVIAPTKGSFSGFFVANGKTNQILGVVLQKQNYATGFFGTSQTGAVLLSE